jgi:hypothetical protein
MSRKAGCGFRAAQALKISATKVRTETLVKQVVVSRKAKLRGIRRRSGAEIPATEVSAETLAKQVMVSRKAGSRDAAGLLCALAQPPRRLEIRRMRYRSGHDPEASGGKRRPSGPF